MQRVLKNYDELSEYLMNAKRILYVHGKSAENFSRLNECLNSSSAILFHFTSFTPNPCLEDAKAALEYSRLKKCDILLAGGGGTAIDVTKYVKLNSPETPLIAIPTTAGSGSEATRFAVLYENGRKLSLTDDNIIPDAVLFDEGLLVSLPEYHRKSSALDALSHAIESFWSVNASEHSKILSRDALTRITVLLEDYPASYNAGAMLMSSYTAGQAINLAQTTAGHAMCYKITGLFGTAHGHSAAMCNRVLFRWLSENTGLEVLNDIAVSMGCESVHEAVLKFEGIFMRMGLEIPEANAGQIEELVSSVNPERLKNFPASLDEHTIRNLYRDILIVKG